MNRVRIGIFLLGTLLATVVAPILGATAAHADWQYAGSSPHGTGCDRDGRTLHTYGMPDPQTGATIGWAYLRYSRTCGVEWVTVNYNSGYYPEPYVWQQNTSGTTRSTSGDSPYQGTVWTTAIEGRYVTDCGGVEIYRSNWAGGNSGQKVGWFYLGCA